MSFAGLLSSLAGPLAKKALKSIGFGVVSYAAISTVVSTLLSAAQSAWGGMTGDVASLLALGGFNSSISIIAAAIVTRISMQSLTRLEIKSGT